jgi:hypothetical protein
MASGPVNRIKRPNTWLHRPMLQNVKKALANPEPSTHGTNRTDRTGLTMSVHQGKTGSDGLMAKSTRLTRTGHQHEGQHSGLGRSGIDLYQFIPLIFSPTLRCKGAVHDLSENGRGTC